MILVIYMIESYINRAIELVWTVRQHKHYNNTLHINHYRLFLMNQIQHLSIHGNQWTHQSFHCAFIITRQSYACGLGPAYMTVHPGPFLGPVGSLILGPGARFPYTGVGVA